MATLTDASNLPASLRDEHQLTFDVGLPGNKPDFGCIKLTGALAVPFDLKRRQEITVVISDADGTVLAQGKGEVTAIAFKDKTDQYGTTTERIHTVSL